MLDTFRNKGYVQLACRATMTQDEKAARQEIDTIKKAGYWVIPAFNPVNPLAPGNNCMDHAYAILKAYGASDMPAPSSAVTPDEFFKQLKRPAWQHGNL
jgi:hypothetical protein